MAKQLNVNLAFTADTSQAKKNIEELQASLNEISSIKPQFGMSLTQDMKEAVSSAKALQGHLNNAFNTKTGNLDLNKLNASLKSAGTDLATLSSGLLRAGQSGEQAFMNIQRSVATASVQIKQANGLLANFWTTMKNTARWQFSSSMLHGFIGAIQSAYSYAKDLDESLNNIRIVTGYNTDAMAAFAEQANKAAKALSTTTTNYTDASLIFYQQGLKGKDVTDRANTVIKMANITGEAAADISDYMTAVWNNFYDGSKSLEYYADAMTALGASTASSTDEIAAGLEKFSAVADTVGLSYEYATAALATVTAETRQSADVVGTAFKTIFARIQGLNLGETLEDGVDLNKYSQALAKVGVDVLDATGQLKDADIILSDMAATWENLSKAQQVALAQAVGGVRQYNQIISLMDNWDVMEENLATVGASEGSLQEQADIYEESWAAASKRVKASLEGLYSDLIPTDFIIEMTDGFAKVIDAIDAMVSGFGGLQSILLLVSSIALNKFGPSLTNGINEGLKSIMNLELKIPDIFNFKPAITGSSKLQSNLAQITGGLNSASSQIQFFNDKLASSASTSLTMSQNMNAGAIKKAADESIILSTSFQNYLTDTSKVYNLQGLIEQNASKLTAAEKERLSIMQEQVLAAAAQKAEAQATLDIATTTLDRTKSKIDGDVFQNKGYYEGVSGGSGQTGVNTLNGTVVQSVMSSMETGFATSNEYATNLLSTWTRFLNELNGTDLALNTINGHLAITSSSTTGLSNGAREAANMYGNIVEVNDDINKILKQQGVSYKDQKKAIQEVIKKAEGQGKISEKVADNYRNALKHTRSFESMSKKITATMTQTEAKANQFAQVLGNSKSHLTNIENGVHGVSSAQTQMTEQENQFNQALEQTVNYLNQVGTKASTIGGMITSGFQGFATIAMGINSISNMIKTLGDESVEFGQKIVSVAMGMTMGFNALKTTVTNVAGAINILSANKKGLVAANAALQASETRASVAIAMSTAASELAAGADEAETTATLANTLASQLGITTKQAEGIATTFVAAAKEGDAEAAAKATVANISLAASEYAVLAPLLIIAAVIGTIIAAFAIWDAVTVSAAEKTERLTENIQNMKDAASEAKEEAEGLKDAFDEYQNVKTTLEECTVGTTEWKEAMEGVKAAIDEILEAYPGLAAIADILKWDEDTQSYILDEEKVNNYIKGQEDAANAMSYGAQMAEGMLLEDRANYSSTDFKDKITHSNYDKNYSNNGLDDLNVSDLTGNEAKDRGIIRNAIKNDVIAGNLVDKEQFATRDEYGNLLYNEEGYQAALDSYVDSQMEANSELIDSLFSIAETYREINEQAQTIYDNATKAKVSEKFTNQGLTEAEMNAAAVATEKDYDTIFTELYGADGTGDAAMAKAFSKEQSSWNTLTEEGKAILTRYENAIGHAINWSDNLVQGNDANRTFHIEGQEDGLTPEEIATTIAAYEALGGEEATESQQASMDIVSGALGSANNIGDALITAITNGGDREAMSNFLAGFTGEELEALMSGIDETGTISEEALKSVGLTAEQLAQVGEIFGLSAEEIGLALFDAGKTITNFTEEQKLNLTNSNINTSKSTIGEQKAFADAKEKAGDYLIEESDNNINFKELRNIENENVDNIEGLTKFYEGLTSIDMNSEDAAEQIRNLASEYGISGEALETFIDKVEELPTVFDVSTTAISENIGKVKEITDGLKMGDTISDEDFKFLESLGIDVDSYFSKMSDGTWKLIGDAEAFANLVNGYGIDELIEQRNDFANNRAQIMDQYGLYSESTLTSTNIHSNAPDNTHKARVDYLQSFEGMDFSNIEGANQILTLDLSDTSLEFTQEQIDTINQMIGEVNSQELQIGDQIASTAKSVDELNDLLAQGKINSENYDKALQAAFENEIETEGFNSEELNDYAEALINSEDALVGTREEANRLAIAHAKMERGINDLVDNWDSWNEALENGSEKEKVATMGKMKKAMADIIGVDVGQISDDFINNAEAMDLMERAANGDMEALDALGPLFAKQYIADIGINNSKFQGDLATLQTDLLGMLEQFQMEDIEIGTSLDTSGYAMAMTKMMAAAGTDIDTINSILAGLGFEPEVSYVDIPVDQYSKMVNSGTTTWQDSEGNSYTAVLDTTLQADESGMVKVPVINGSKTTFKGGGSSAASSGAKKGGGGGGGGGSKPKKADKVKKTDVVERYKEIDDKLDDTADKMDDASKAADRLWGPARLKQMKKINDALEEEIDALKKKRKEAQDNFDIDKKALKDAISTEAGVTITDADFDAEGNFIKYDEVLTDLYNEIDAAITAANADGNADEDEQEKIDKIQERIDKVKEAIDQYDETRELIEDLDNDIQDKIYELQDNNYEQLNYELEFKLEIEDSNLELVEYYLGKIEDDIYATVEAFGYMNQQVDIYTNKLQAQEEYVGKLEEEYLAGRISLDAYKEGLRESQNAMIENLEALQEQKEAMQDYYGEVMDMALEEISLYTDEMEELNSVLDHYSNILELVGKQEDYATKSKILQSKATNLRNEMQVQQELYEKSNAEAEKWAVKMATAIEGSNEYETYKKNWIAAQEAANEAQDNMLSKTEEWAEAMKSIVENELAGLAKTMEEFLTGGTSFDELLTSMERRSSLQEEYLTTTNQIYETNKLMRQAQQEIDKTTNSVAKRKLANFINETEQMQNQTELSQYELDIQQAKYDLLLAQIALEEAQSAKSTVRLQRDSEGNFGYVYTADQAAVANAKQELADKQNALYNLGLEGANDYSQKYAETMQEAQDAITELTEMWMNGEIESEEEYQRRRAEIQDYYYEKLKQYSSLYQVALTTDSNVIKDAWSTDFSDMIYKTEDWKVATDDYFAGAAESMKTWAEVCGTVLKESGLDDVSKKVGEINTKSEDLKKTLIGEDGESGVVGAMMSEVEAAGKLSEAYIGIQNQIDETIRKYEKMMGVINEDYTNKDTPKVSPEVTTSNNKVVSNPATTSSITSTGKQVSSSGGSGSSGGGNTYSSGGGKIPSVSNNYHGVNSASTDELRSGTNTSGGRWTYNGKTYYSYSEYLQAKQAHQALLDRRGFATGGYTGSWGSYGKLAILHEKELVLNKKDTENFLQAMDLLDKIVSAIDLYSMNSQLGGALSSPSLGNMGSGDVLEQQVHIEASFPGVQDRNEIEEAFNTLINRASQYANRK